MMVKTIIIESRHPRTKMEKDCYGVTYDHENIARVFINSRLVHGKEFADTFFHEMMHVFANFTSKKKLKQEEKKAKLMGKAAQAILYGE